MTKITAILACGGTGNRVGLGYNKLRFDIGGISILEKTISAWIRSDIDSIIIACNAEDIHWLTKITCNYHGNIKLCVGGATRCLSISNALELLDDDCDYVAIHDGARPFINQITISNAIECAKSNGNAITVTDCVDSIRIITTSGNNAVDRNHYKLVQTPQIFKADLLRKAYKRAIADNLNFSDDASLYEHYIGAVTLCEGQKDNIKITTKSDLHVFYPTYYFVGIGWDTHQLVEGRKLILGGIEIPHNKGLLGHSDADVLIHAIMDSLLCASNNDNIGILFPDDDNSFKNIDSKILLTKVCELLKTQGFAINNISATIMAQRPKLKDFMQAMQKQLASTMNIEDFRITLTATTTEKLGLVGKEEAISCQAFCSIKR